MPFEWRNRASLVTVLHTMPIPFTTSHIQLKQGKITRNRRGKKLILRHTHTSLPEPSDRCYTKKDIKGTSLTRYTDTVSWPTMIHWVEPLPFVPLASEAGRPHTNTHSRLRGNPAFHTTATQYFSSINRMMPEPRVIVASTTWAITTIKHFPPNASFAYLTPPSPI